MEPPATVDIRNDREARFWDKIEKTSGGCWTYTGYERVCIGLYRGAHRITWHLCHNRMDFNGHLVRLCNNDQCCRPGHYRLKVEPFGVRRKTDDIKAMLQRGYRDAEIVEELGVHRSTVFRIRKKLCL